MIVNLEFSRNTIKCVCLQKKGNGLVVSQAYSLPVPCDVFDEENSEKVTALLKTFFKQHRIPLQKVYFSLCHNDIVFQELTLPVMPDPEIHEAVKNEIERVPRFASEEYHYSYQSIHQRGENKIHILSLAMPQSVFEVPLRILKSAGCAIQGFDVVPLSVLSLAEKVSSGENIGVLVVCEHITYFLIMRDNVCEKIYLANSGTDDLLQGEAAAVDQKALKLWLEEIHRILKFYEVEQHRVSPRMYVVWDNERIADLLQHVGTLVRQEVLPLEMPRSVQFSKRVNFLKLNHMYAPLVGMGLPGGSHRRFNLERIWNKKKTHRYQRKIVICGAIYLICVGVLGARTMSFFSQKTHSLDFYRQELSRQIEDLEKRTDKLRAERAHYEQLKENILKQATVISNLNRRSWAKTFSRVGENIPEDVWLQSFTFNREGECELQGNSFHLESVADFMRTLEKTGYFSEVKLDFTKERQVEGQTLVEFGIVMNVVLKQDAVQEKD